MASSPLVVLAICVPTLIFQAMLVGALQGAPEFPTFAQSAAVCEGDGIAEAIKCPFAWLLDLFRVIGAGGMYFFGLMTFNVPGAPWFIRGAISSMVGGPTIWAIATLFRGN